MLDALCIDLLTRPGGTRKTREKLFKLCWDRNIVVVAETGESCGSDSYHCWQSGRVAGGNKWCLMYYQHVRVGD